MLLNLMFHYEKILPHRAGRKASRAMLQVLRRGCLTYGCALSCDCYCNILVTDISEKQSLSTNDRIFKEDMPYLYCDYRRKPLSQNIKSICTCTWGPKEQEGEIESIEMLSPVMTEKPPGHILMRSSDVLALMFTEHFIF